MSSASRIYRLTVGTLGTLLVATLLTAVPQHAAQAAGPTVMIVHGEPLATPVRINLWDAGLNALSGPEFQGDASELRDRPYLNLGFLWGPAWNAYLDAGGTLETLQPEQATWHGRLYPAAGDEQPVIYATGYGNRLLDAELVSRLEAHGVPVGPSFEGSAGGGSISPALWWGLGLTTILLIGSLFVARARDPARKLGPGTPYGYR